MITFIFILVYVLAIIFDFLPIIRAHNKKETVVYGAMLTLSFVITFLYSIGVKVPRILPLLEGVIKIGK
jgi:hypothetical protein